MAAAGPKKKGKRAAPVRTSREEIQSKAQELFLKKGYHGASTSDVCEALGISRPTLYWYFSSKEELIFSIHKDTVESRLLPMLERVGDIADPLERLSLLIDEYTCLICTEPGTKVQIKETEYMAPEHQEWVKKNWRQLLHLVRDAIAELQAAGRARPLNQTFAAFCLLGMITWAYTWFDESKSDGPAELAQTVRELFLSGLLLHRD